MSGVRRTMGFTLLWLGALALPGFGQGWIEPIRPMRGGQIDKVRSAVQVTVTGGGRVAQVTVEEWFRNVGAIVSEGSYLYPLPGEAAFTNFSLWQGDQELRGETMDAAQARAIYEEIVRRRKDPALIELADHGLIRARVFPINPGETRKITLRYTQLLDRTGDAWRLRYATGAGAAGTGATTRSFRLVVDSAARIGEPYSPTHRFTTRREGDRLEATLADTNWSGDLEVLLPLTRGLVGMSLLTEQPSGEDGYFMLLLAPGAARQAAALRRDVVAVVDVSGSMSGEKIEQAKAALVQLLGTLRDGDRFRLVAFSSGVRRYADAWTASTADNRRRAEEWVRSLVADGGTNIAGALAEAFAQAPPGGGDALGVVVFLTDGLPSVGESNPERIAEQAERERGAFRVFSFGIGYDVNTYLLDRLTVRARGTAEYIQPGGDIERAVGSLAAKIASPVLTDLTLSGASGLELYDVQPGSLPDLFAGDEMVVFGRLRGAGGTVTVTGQRGGRREQFSTTATSGGAGNAYIAQLWASRKAGALAREIRLRGANPEVLNELKQLALRYGILTEYTSYLVQEPGLVAGRPVQLQQGRLNAPLPAAQSGAGAVARAREEAKTASIAVAADAAEIDATLRARAGIAPTTRVANRLFILRDSVWTDLRLTDSLGVVTVEPYSDAYFALLRALPELVKPAALAPAVVVAGERVGIKIQTGGTTAWGAGELERIVREFRS